MPYLLARSDCPVTEDAPGLSQVPWEMPASPAYRLSMIAERRLKTFQRDVYVRARRAITSLLESERVRKPRIPYDNPFITGWDFHDVFIYTDYAIVIIYSFSEEILSIDYIDPEVSPSGGSSLRSGLCYSLINSYFLLVTSSVRVAAMDQRILTWPEVASDTTSLTTARLTVVDGNHRCTAMSVLAVNMHLGGFAVALGTTASSATTCWSIDGGRLGVALRVTDEVRLGGFAAGLVGDATAPCGATTLIGAGGTVCMGSLASIGPITYDAGTGTPVTDEVRLGGFAAGLVGDDTAPCGATTLIGAGGTVCMGGLAGIGPITYDAGTGTPVTGEVRLGGFAPIFPCADEPHREEAVIPGSGIGRKRVH